MTFLDENLRPISLGLAAVDRASARCSTRCSGNAGRNTAGAV